MTFRAVLVGCAGAFCVSAGAVYSSLYLKGSYMSLGTSMPAAIFLFFILTGLVNPLLKRLHPQAGLRRSELVLVYIMMAMASPIPTFFAIRFLSQIVDPFYFASPENEWAELVHPYIADWIRLDGPVHEAFFEGLGQGQSVPWKAWMPTFAVWSPLIWALFLAMIAAMVLLRKQWIENERLTYPLAQVPLAIIEERNAGECFSPFYKHPVMWIGFALPFLWGTLHGLHNYFPEWVPFAADKDMINISVPLWQDSTELLFKFRFNILGFFYFLKTDIAFSMWFFNLLSNAVRGLFVVLGITDVQLLGNHAVRDPILAHQSMGAMVVLCLGGLWAARRHLKDVARKAFLGDQKVDDSAEILSYRAAVIILVVSTAVIVGWLWLAGMPVWVALVFLLLAAVLIIGFTRVVAEAGLSDGSPPAVPATILVAAVGSSAIGSQGLILLATTYFWSANVRSFVMTSCANSLRLGEELKSGRRGLFWVMILALAVALTSAVWMAMTLSYEYGAINMRMASDRWAFGQMGRLVHSPSEPYLWSWIHMGIGAAIMLGLSVARWQYVWWPLHPLGYPIGPIWIMDHLWFNMFLAWGIKVVVLKYGGVRLYRTTRPFFLGMILGQITPGGIYLIIDHYTGMVGNMIFAG